MNILLDDLPTDIDGLKINSDFRIMVMFESLMFDLEFGKKEKSVQALNLFYKNTRELKDINKAVEGLLWFYKGGKDVKQISGTTSNKNKQIYSFEFDDLHIYSAFRQQYGINLHRIDYLHWWEFKALFNNLNESTLMVKIMGYRSVDLNDFKKDKKMKSFYSKMKKLYELPDMRSEEEKEADIEASFW